MKLRFESSVAQQLTPESDGTPVGLSDWRGHACRVDLHGRER